MHDDSLPGAVLAAYDLWIWLDGRLADFPAWARHGAGRRIGDAAIDVIDGLLEATYLPRGDPGRRVALTRANQRLALLRLLLRGARDRRYLSVDQHEHAAVRAVELGQMIGGWLRSMPKPTAPPG
jgi:hypothetical protein